VVARGRGFWEHFYPPLQRLFGEQLSSVPLVVFHRAINKVARSLIRTDADEVTYNLHIMLRFNLENKLLEGKLRVKDLPEAWHAAMQADLNIAPSNDRDGCLQDAHWYSGYIGGRFQSYTVGIFYRRSFMRRLSRRILTSRAKSPVANSARCTVGYATILTGMETSSRRTISLSAQPGRLRK
jgi:Zn-dependent M32 family carboxypeptidase